MHYGDGMQEGGAGCREEFNYVAEFKLDVSDSWLWGTLRTLEKEVRFPRGYLMVVNKGVVLCAKDLTSLRSLVNTLLRVLYVLLSLRV